MIQGVVVNLAGQDYIIPALSFKQLRALETDLAQLEGLKGRPTPEQQDVVVRIVQAAVSRNYPDVTIEQLSDMMDMANFLPTIEAVMGVSGLKQKGEA